MAQKYRGLGFEAFKWWSVIALVVFILVLLSLYYVHASMSRADADYLLKHHCEPITTDKSGMTFQCDNNLQYTITLHHPSSLVNK